MHVYIDEGASKCCDSSQKPRARRRKCRAARGSLAEYGTLYSTQ